MIFLDNRTTNTTTYTSRHFYKAIMYFAFFKVFKHLNAIFNTINCNISIAFNFAHSFKYATCCREETRTAIVIVILNSFYFNFFFLKPFRKFFKSENCINNSVIIFCFVLFSNTRTYKNRFCVWDSLFDILTMCLHW